MNQRAAPVPFQRAASGESLALALKFALRELRGGLAGFYIFLGCIAIGVAAIAGVNSVASAISATIAAEGRAILGGDVAVSLVQQRPPAAALAFLSSQGIAAETITLRAMARRADGADQALAEIKAVDALYPLFGKLKSPDGYIDMANTRDDEVWADPVLLERLAIGRGDTLLIGNARFAIAGLIAREPDRIGEGMILGPRVLMSLGGLAKAGLVQPGSLFTSSFKLALNDASPAGVKRFVARAKKEFGETGWRVRSHENAAPSLSRNIERFSQFLTLVGLAALIVGGVGVANSVSAFIDLKRPVIATLKSVGGSGHFIFMVYLAQVLFLAVAGIAIGLVAGAILPFAAREALAGILPIDRAQPLYPLALAQGAVFGLLTAFVFAVWPLASAREVEAASLFRSMSLASANWPRPAYLAAIAAAMALLAALAFFGSSNRFVAGIFLAAIGVVFVALRGVAYLLQLLASKAPRARTATLRLAIANIHRPGSLAPSVVLSLGLGLSLIAALSLIDVSLRQQVTRNLPQKAPDFFFLDIPKSQFDAFEAKLKGLAPKGEIVSVPMLRGRITTLKGIAADRYPVGENGGWVLRGDRGVTYSATMPKNATLSAGQWWPQDYQGEPLVSFSAHEAGELELGVGDRIEVNVLGRKISAEIANLREVEWETLGINFVMVFSPNAFAGAPHSFLATLTAGGQISDDGKVVREISAAFPSVAAIRVRDALEQVNGLIRQLGTAIRAASGVALAASALVLAGALAAGARVRNHDAVVMKTLGATRPVLLRALVYEFAILGAATGLFSLGAGALAAYLITTRIMGMPFHLDPAIGLGTIAGALLVTVALGLAGTFRILGQKAAPVLREM